MRSEEVSSVASKDAPRLVCLPCTTHGLSLLVGVGLELSPGPTGRRGHVLKSSRKSGMPAPWRLSLGAMTVTRGVDLGSVIAVPRHGRDLLRLVRVLPRRGVAKPAAWLLGGAEHAPPMGNMDAGGVRTFLGHRGRAPGVHHGELEQAATAGGVVEACLPWLGHRLPPALRRPGQRCELSQMGNPA